MRKHFSFNHPLEFMKYLLLVFGKRDYRLLRRWLLSFRFPLCISLSEVNTFSISIHAVIPSHTCPESLTALFLSPLDSVCWSCSQCLIPVSVLVSNIAAYSWACIPLLHYDAIFRTYSYQICSFILNPKLCVEDLAQVIPRTKTMKTHNLAHVKIYVFYM